jgi:hypothetical protein
MALISTVLLAALGALFRDDVKQESKPASTEEQPQA